MTPGRSESRSFCVVQISDCHLAADAAQPYRGQDADAGLHAVVGSFGTLAPDLILGTGDFSEDASPGSYLRLQTCLELTHVPICALPGNHDDSAIMRRYFPQGPWQGPMLIPAGGWHIAVLNSARAGRIDGEVAAADLERLSELLHSRPGIPVLLALHHQPIPVGSRWIDRYPLANSATLRQWVQRHSEVRCVTWGHVHQSFDQQQDGVRWMSAPSTAANSLPETERFTLDPAGPACRWFRLHADGAWSTGVLHAA